MKKTNKNLTSFADHLNKQYGKRGTKTRENYEEGFEAFKLGVMLQELRKGPRYDSRTTCRQMWDDQNLYFTH